MKRTPLILTVLAAACMFSSCKTTEKNYRDAYDIAIVKQQKEDSLQAQRRREMGMEGLKMEENSDGAVLSRIGDRRVRTLHRNFARADSVKQYSPAVSYFKMPANAGSMVEDLRARGWVAARQAKSGDRYYVLLGTFDDVSPAIDLLEEFIRKEPRWQSVGLHEPTLITSNSSSQFLR